MRRLGGRGCIFNLGVRWGVDVAGGLVGGVCMQEEGITGEDIWLKGMNNVLTIVRLYVEKNCVHTLISPCQLHRQLRIESQVLVQMLQKPKKRKIKRKIARS